MTLEERRAELAERLQAARQQQEAAARNAERLTGAIALLNTLIEERDQAAPRVDEARVDSRTASMLNDRPEGNPDA